MNYIKLIRVEAHPDHGVLGVLVVNGEALGCTLEPYHRSNARNISSIPEGAYICKRYSSKKYPDTFQVIEVQGRTKILFHSGNTDDDTAGCILLGSSFGKLGDRRAVLNSGATFQEFLDRLAGVGSFRLIIESSF